MTPAWARALLRGGQVPVRSLRRPLAGGGGGDARSRRGDGDGGGRRDGGDGGDDSGGAGDRGDTGDRGGAGARGGGAGDTDGADDVADPVAALEAALAALETAPGGGGRRRGGPALSRAVTLTLGVAESAGPAPRRRLYRRLLRLLRPPPGAAPPGALRRLLAAPPHLETGLRVLEHMEAHGVVPDEEAMRLLSEAFGPRSRPVRKAQRMRYWLPRFRHADPHRDGDSDSDGDEDGDGVLRALERARRGLRRMAADMDADVTVLQMPVTTTLSSGEEQVLPFIIGSQSAQQRHLLSLAAARRRPLLVEGPLPLWLRGRRLSYYVMRAEPAPGPAPEPPPEPERSFYFPLQLELDLERGPWDDDDFDVDEVAEGPVLALCVAGDGDRATLARWVALLQATNPALGDVPVLFRLGTGGPPAADCPPVAAVAPPGAGDARTDTGDTSAGGSDTPLGAGDTSTDSGDTPRDGGDTPQDGGDTPRHGGDTSRRDNDDDNETPRVLPGDRVRGQG